MRIYLFLAGLIALVSCTTETLEADDSPPESFDVRYDVENAASFRSLKVELPQFSMKFAQGFTLPLWTRLGYTGIVICGQGTISFKDARTGKSITDVSKAAIVRFHPQDWPKVVDLEGSSSFKDSSAMRHARNVMRELFGRCYESRNRAIIPPTNTIAVVFDGSSYGSKILIHSTGKETTIHPNLDQLMLRKSLKTARDAPNLSRNEKWCQDVQYLALELPLHHCKPYYRISEATFQKAAREIQDTVSDRTDTQIILDLCKIVSLLGDSHTEVNPGVKVPMHMFPVKLEWFKDGLFAIEATKEYRHVLGCRLVKIGTTDIQDACKRVAEYIGYENEAQRKKKSTLMMLVAELLVHAEILSSPETGSFTFEDENGKSILLNDGVVPMKDYWKMEFVSLPRGSEGDLPVSLQKKKVNYWYEYLEDFKTLYFQYNKCRDHKDLPMTKFTEEFLTFLDSHPVKCLIIDLRDNEGGISPPLDPLIQELKKRPINKKGHLFGFVGRKTYSAAIINAVTLRNETEITFVGEPTSGKPNHFGEVRRLYLPHSGLCVNYSSRLTTLAKNDTDSFMPDIHIEISSRDFFSVRDPYLETILKQVSN